MNKQKYRAHTIRDYGLDWNVGRGGDRGYPRRYSVFFQRNGRMWREYYASLEDAKKGIREIIGS